MQLTVIIIIAFVVYIVNQTTPIFVLNTFSSLEDLLFLRKNLPFKYLIPLYVFFFLIIPMRISAFWSGKTNSKVKQFSTQSTPDKDKILVFLQLLKERPRPQRKDRVKCKWKWKKTTTKKTHILSYERNGNSESKPLFCSLSFLFFSHSKAVYTKFLYHEIISCFFFFYIFRFKMGIGEITNLVPAHVHTASTAKISGYTEI